MESQESRNPKNQIYLVFDSMKHILETHLCLRENSFYFSIIYIFRKWRGKKNIFGYETGNMILIF